MNLKRDVPWAGLKVRLLGSGAILREVEAAPQMLAEEQDVSSEVLSVTGFTELRREALDAERWSMLHPEAEPRMPYLTHALASGTGPVIAATDCIKALADGCGPTASIRKPPSRPAVDQCDPRSSLTHIKVPARPQLLNFCQFRP